MTSKRLIIFEGPDGSGKTTLAKRYAELHAAHYVHFSNLPHLDKGLARVYVEAMLPALLGYQDVVFDRSWLSEVPYGATFRGGQDRLGTPTRRMLERLALRCGAVVVRCLPPFETCARNFNGRRKQEYLQHDEQLRQVYDLYKVEPTALPCVDWDYTTHLDEGPDVAQTELHHVVSFIGGDRHPVALASAGSWEAKVLLVGEKFSSPKEHDAFYQWPFASFSQGGCSQWLTQLLETEGLGEHKLLWVNADQDIPQDVLERRTVVALGGAAHELLLRRGVETIHVPHPQAHKRFHHSERYELLDILKRCLR